MFSHSHVFVYASIIYNVKRIVFMFDLLEENAYYSEMEFEIPYYIYKFNFSQNLHLN